MPEVSRFFGIVIAMYYNDHEPAHFPVRYGERKAVIDIETLGVLRGMLTPRSLSLVVDWAAQHREELMANWLRARNQEPLAKIAPLE